MSISTQLESRLLRLHLALNRVQRRCRKYGRSAQLVGTKSTVMSERGNAQVSCSGLLKVLADETRLIVVRQLMEGPKHVGEINKTLGLEQSLLSHHLKVLREAGLVIGERDGKAVLYSLAPEFQGSSFSEAINLGCCLISFEA